MSAHEGTFPAGARRSDTIDWTQETLLVVALLVGAAGFRLLRLHSLPPGFHIDEAYNMLDALRILGGEWPVFLPANAGRDVLYSYPQAAMVALLGANVYALRATSALIGIATVGVTYGFIRTLTRSRPVAALTALLLAGTFWHVAFSRFGIRAIALPLVEVLTFWFFWRGIRAQRPLDYAVSGLFLGLGAYTHPAGRLVPLVLLAFAAYLVYEDRQAGRRYVNGVLIVALVAVIVFLPLGVYFWGHPDAFFGHPAEVSVLTADGGTGVPPGTSLTQLATNAWRVMQMFTWRGDTRWWRNLAGRPVFDPLMGLAFVLGLGLLLGRALRSEPTSPLSPEATNPTPVARSQAWDSTLGRDEAVFTLLAVGIMLLPTWLTDQAPNFSRAIGILPLVLLPPALALAAIWHWAAQAGRLWVQAGVVAVLVVSLGWTAWDYFGVYAGRPELYYAFDQDKVDIARYLHDAAAIDRVYTSRFLADHPTVRFLTRDIDVDSFDMAQGLVLPVRKAERGARYAFWARNPADNAAGALAAARARLAPIADPGAVVDAQGNLLLTIFRIPPRQLPVAGDQLLATLPAVGAGDAALLRPANARFGDVAELVGWSVDGELEPGADAALRLVWYSLQPVDVNYTVFVHLVDDAGDQWAQHDKPPLGGTYPTSIWEPDEVVVDQYPVHIPSEAPAPSSPTGDDGGFVWRVGLYDPQTLERVPAFKADGVQWDANAVVLQ